MGIIPARLHSTRLPEKPLQDLGGKPLVVRVLERARLAGSLEEVVVATDSDRIASVVRAAGGAAVLTDPKHPSGLDRVAEAAERLAGNGTAPADPGAVIVNLQGDEPFLESGAVDSLVALFEDPEVRMATLAAPLPAAEVADPNRVKVVLDRDRRALYFSRSPIPHGGADAALLHLGVYAYRRETLLALARLPQAPPERAERLEQLRALWHGIPIHVAVGDWHAVGVDTPEDLARARTRFAGEKGAS